MTIGKLLRETRLKNDIMQKTVSEKLKCRTQFISLIEADKCKVPLHMMKAWCALIKLNPAKLKAELLKEYAQEIDGALK